MNNLKKIANYLNNSMQRSLSHAAHQLVAVGAIAFLGFPLFYWIWTECFPQPYETLSLRLIGSLLGLGLMLTPYWPLSAKRYLPGYWFLTILYTLSFFFAFSFLMNQASVISAMSLLCSVFLLVLLVDLPSLIVLLLLGWGLALISYYMIAPHYYFGEEHLELALVLLFVIVAGSTVNYKTAMLQQQRLAGMAAAAGMIAHELRTPLLGIKSGARAMALYSPQLFRAYDLAKEHGLLKSAIRDNRLQQLKEISDRIISEIDYANTIIDMLLIKAARENSLQNCILETCSIAECLEEAMARYPFKSQQERSLVEWEGDFNFIGSKLLMQHVLFNLLKNALYVIATAQKGQIKIWTKGGDKFNSLYFRDSAKGMSYQQLSKLFNHFYSTTFMGTGIGLSFCKLVMNRFGGDIRCEAEEGLYTQFTLMFPVTSTI
ncbi:sensor histidine kinase [Legionella jordanis]|uniref:histidine kinase n=1 Tax=Legionella jordanis TaxID=456 RepID=A0A0W0VBS5_9GAMM|nr:HAMP domain-containing sensor histidine kinase [Legionella jordanis]KTD17562.1 sensor protein LuxN [Legionella jordanis]RMX05102.1 sensor histidine kinase [Legionella jordanis]RMX17358.1 sensor histidine kinase [Legionella jordanis]VEH13531.1 sensor protein LuxN [Legionella jordanis]HAT8714447.1 sensor histidine kinase [Legionella jordanis]